MGNPSVYYLFYADITGTKSITFQGSSGMQLRVLMNRSEPIESGDSNGGSYVEMQVTIGDDGVAVLDLSNLEYVHLNSIKCGWGSPNGTITSVLLEGTVRPVTGILSMINNGDAEGDDLGSFPCSYDGPNNGGVAEDRPEIVEGGIDGSRCFKFTTFEDPRETWHSQFYIKTDEMLPRGAKWKLKMAVKADRDAIITSSSMSQPRSWKGYFMDEFAVSTEWREYTWTGEIGVDEFQSIGFDLSNEYGNPGNAGISFYFDNIEFGIDLGANPMKDLAITAGADVICVNFNGQTNITSLINDYGVNTDAGRTFIFDNSCAKVSINGVDQPIVSVEGREDGNLYIFLDDDAVTVDDEETEVKVAFTNSEDADRRLLFTTGKWEGQAVPDFSGIIAEYNEELGVGDIYSYMWGVPALVTIEPEAGSFNLPADFKEFKVTFNQDVKAESLVAKLGNEALTVSSAEGLSKVFTLTRTAATEIKGTVELVISSATGVKGAKLQEPIAIKYSYGPVSADAQPEILFTDNFGADGRNHYVPAGWVINSDSEGREAGDYGSGCRVIVGGANSGQGFTNAIAYICSRSGSGETPGRAC
jgi:hypothetical protein